MVTFRSYHLSFKRAIYSTTPAWQNCAKGSKLFISYTISVNQFVNREYTTWNRIWTGQFAQKRHGRSVNWPYLSYYIHYIGVGPASMPTGPTLRVHIHCGRNWAWHRVHSNANQTRFTFCSWPIMPERAQLTVTSSQSVGSRCLPSRHKTLNQCWFNVGPAS